MNKKIENIDLDSLPTLPTVYQALLDKLDDPKATVNDIASTITLDISSTSKLLQIVNSSMFSFRSKIDTISQAITLIGINEVRNTILTIAITDYFRNFKKDKDFAKLDLWQHSIATGIISKIIAKQIGVAKPETLFISGLLHDVGKLVLIFNFKKDYLDNLLNETISDKRLYEIEKEKFSYSHDEIGYELVARWNIGIEISSTIKNHHIIDFSSQNIVDICIVYLANIIAKIMNLGKSGNPHIEKPDNRIWEVLNLNPGFLKSTYNEIMNQYIESSKILKL